MLLAPRVLVCPTWEPGPTHVLLHHRCRWTPWNPKGMLRGEAPGSLSSSGSPGILHRKCFCSRLPRAMQRPAGWTGWGCWESGGGTCGLGPGLREGRLGAPHGHTCPCLSVEASLSNASFSHVGKPTQPSIMCLKYRSCRRYRRTSEEKGGWLVPPRPACGRRSRKDEADFPRGWGGWGCHLWAAAGRQRGEARGEPGAECFPVRTATQSHRPTALPPRGRALWPLSARVFL